MSVIRLLGLTVAPTVEFQKFKHQLGTLLVGTLPSQVCLYDDGSDGVNIFFFTERKGSRSCKVQTSNDH